MYVHMCTCTTYIHTYIHTCSDTSESTLDLFDFQEVELVIYLFRLSYSLKLSPYYHQDMPLSLSHFHYLSLFFLNLFLPAAIER